MIPVFVHHSDANYIGLCRYVSERIWDGARDFGAGTAMAVLENGALKAAIIYHNYDSQAGVVEFSGAGDTERWLTRPVLLEMFRYPFVELECQAAVARIDGENHRLARQLTAYGFDRYDIPRLRGRDRAETIMVLTDDAWKANKFHKEHEYG